MNKKDKLLYDLIYSKKVNYEIPYMEYISEIKYMENFTEDILCNISKAKIEIIEQTHILTNDQKVWLLKVKR